MPGISSIAAAAFTYPRIQLSCTGRRVVLFSCSCVHAEQEAAPSPRAVMVLAVAASGTTRNTARSAQAARMTASSRAWVHQFTSPAGLNVHNFVSWGRHVVDAHATRAMTPHLG